MRMIGEFSQRLLLLILTSIVLVVWADEINLVKKQQLEDTYPNELVDLESHKIFQQVHSPLPHEYILQVPSSFTWSNVNRTSFLTRSLNQHIPQYCGSCFAHAALSSLAEYVCILAFSTFPIKYRICFSGTIGQPTPHLRVFLFVPYSRIKISRNAAADDINLSIQYILNCGGKIAGSCKGGSASGVYEFIQNHSGYVPYDTCQPYIACSSNSDFGGICSQVDTSCNPSNICKTCTMKFEPSIHPFGQICREIDVFPNATIAEYGMIRLSDEMDPLAVQEKVMAEVFARGPVAAAVNGQALHEYQGGIYRDTNASRQTTHMVSIVGWGVTNNSTEPYWIIRNSWGQYWGEMGYARILSGKNVLGIEESIVWATPGQYTVQNFPCSEDGTNCGPKTEYYKDPSQNMESVRNRLGLYGLTL